MFETIYRNTQGKSGLSKQAYLKMMGLKNRVGFIKRAEDLETLQQEKHQQQKNINAAKILSAIAGGAIGGLTGGPVGAIFGSGIGLLGHWLANVAGKSVGNITGPRTEEGYKEYLKDRSPFLEYFTPGKIGYNEGRQERTLETLQKNKSSELPKSIDKKARLVDVLSKQAQLTKEAHVKKLAGLLKKALIQSKPLADLTQKDREKESLI